MHATTNPLPTNVKPSSMNSADETGRQTPLRELSKQTQDGWIERLFSRLLASYGSQFSAMWAGTNPEEVKAAWAEDLGPFSGKQIAWALEVLKANADGEHDFPPNLPKFRRLCSMAPRPAVAALPAPQITLEQVQKRAEELGVIKAKAERVDYKKWAREIMADPKKYPAVSVRYAKEALEMAE